MALDRCDRGNSVVISVTVGQTDESEFLSTLTKKLKRLEEVKALKEQPHSSKNEIQKVEESNRNLIAILVGFQSTIADQQSMIMKLQEENSKLRNHLGYNLHYNSGFYGRQ